jgi:hypothetical protein
MEGINMWYICHAMYKIPFLSFCSYIKQAQRDGVYTG